MLSSSSRLSSTSSSSSSSTPFSFSNTDNNPHYYNNSDSTQQKSKTMEEVWKDIASLPDHPSSDHHQDLSTYRNLPSSHRHHHNPNFILQDFFATPARIVSTTTAAAKSVATSTTNHYGSSTVPPPPATVLSLNSSSPCFDFLDSSDPLIRPSSHPVSNVTSFNSPFHGFDSSPGLPCFGKNRESGGSSCDHRHKRMMKNRESAARSRARKQAYTNELEREVKQLRETNAILKRQQEELCIAAAGQLTKKHTLYRTSTAPF